MKNVTMARYSTRPPTRPINLNGILYNYWRNVITGVEMKWDGEKWKEVIESDSEKPT